MKVWVTYDPLNEKPICVHEKEDMTCLLCDAIRNENRSAYQLESKKFEVQKEEEEKLFIVRLYDMFDGWIDVSRELSKEEAEKELNLNTENGTKNTKYEDGSYYCIFPAVTRMWHTPEKRGR